MVGYAGVHMGVGFYNSVSYPYPQPYPHPYYPYPYPYGPHYAVAMDFPPYMGYVHHHDVYFVDAHVVHHHKYFAGSKSFIWVDASPESTIPHHAIIGGKEPNSQQALYICRAEYLDGVHPGRLDNGKCTFTYHGNEIRANRYQLLVSKNPMRWLSASFGEIPRHSIAAGRDHGKPLYICQATYQGGKLPGKVIGEDCHIGYQGRVIALPHYKVLTA